MRGGGEVPSWGRGLVVVVVVAAAVYETVVGGMADERKKISVQRRNKRKEIKNRKTRLRNK